MRYYCCSRLHAKCRRAATAAATTSSHRFRYCDADGGGARATATALQRFRYCDANGGAARGTATASQRLCYCYFYNYPYDANRGAARAT